FEKYRDPDDPTTISPEGCQRLFKDLGVSLESMVPLIIAWKLDAKRMGFITEIEWSNGAKTMSYIALALWQVLLVEKYPMMTSFIQFINQEYPVKVINKDQWMSLLDFCRTVGDAIDSYDSTSSWPVLFDDYVEWKRKIQ
ncbi:hypothetical protein K501DRAFT_185471, partial [Backusella circina FSU 941]